MSTPALCNPAARRSEFPDRRTTVAWTRTPRLTAVFLLVLLVYLLWATLAVGAHAWNTSQPAAPPMVLCLSQRLLDIPCPTCGGTRVAVSYASLDLAAAWRNNPLLTLAIPIVGVLLTIRLLFGQTLRVQLAPSARRTAWATAAVALLANWAWVWHVHA